jgi:hypothetical protein
MTVDQPDRQTLPDATLTPMLEQARAALDAAVTLITVDPEAACDDIIAARLLVNAALVSLAAHR